MKKVLFLIASLTLMLSLAACKRNEDIIDDGPELFAITFETNGAAEYESEYYEYFDDIDVIDSPTKEGYIFKGWYTDIHTTIPFTDSTMPFGDLTLYAKWEIDITILPKLVLEASLNTWGFDEILAINIDDSNNYYFYYSDMSELNRDASISKSNSDFDILWTYNIEGDCDDIIEEVFIDSHGDILLPGYSKSNDLDYTVNDYAIDDMDAMLVKLDEFGNEIFGYTYGGSGMDYFISMVEQNGFYYLFGETTSIDGDFVSNVSLTHSEFVMKVDTDGEIISIKYLDDFASDYDWFEIVELQLIYGSIYIFGNVTEVSDLDIISQYMFVAKANIDLEIDWVYYHEVDEIERFYKNVIFGEFIEVYGATYLHEEEQSQLVYIRLDYLGNVKESWDSEFIFDGRIEILNFCENNYFATISKLGVVYAIIGEKGQYDYFTYFTKGNILFTLVDNDGSHLLIGSLFTYLNEHTFSGIIKIEDY